ncbi:hypothetical protein R1sor_021283 [Riccia sorocarpa]|uniref:Uncharacterized protein n=1 Tax=Riccia sorocarpa TaxID=122646 RepID=A0ABD3GIH3_9MARC
MPRAKCPPPSPGYNPAPTPGYNPAPTPGYNPVPTPDYNPAPTPGYNPAPTPGYNLSSTHDYNPKLWKSVAPNTITPPATWQRLRQREYDTDVRPDEWNLSADLAGG